MSTPSDSLPDLVVDSATGVDVSLPVAGPGARSFAFVVDWLIRVVLLIAWYVVGTLVFNGGWSLQPPVEPSVTWFGLVVSPAVGIYLLYHPVLEIAMRGRTPGKRAAGVRIVTRHGAVPAVPAHLIRNVFRLVDGFPPIFYGIGLVMVVVTRDHVRIGDLAAGTLLVYDRGQEAVLEHVSPVALGGAGLDATTAEVVNDLLMRWEMLEPDVRGRLARTLLAKVDRSGVDVTTLHDAAAHEQLRQLALGDRHG
jgi:uncharacterized RDD family membrane protein YckC